MIIQISKCTPEELKGYDEWEYGAKKCCEGCGKGILEEIWCIDSIATEETLAFLCSSCFGELQSKIDRLALLVTKQ